MNPRLPDYEGGSVLNLMAAIIRSRGGVSPHPGLRDTPDDALRAPDRLVYLVIDGLGWEQLEEHLAKGEGQRFFARHPRRRLTTVAPATTAAAITTFSTGASPAEHALLGWHLNLPDLGLVSTILKTVTRTGTPMVPAGFDLAGYLDLPSHLATTRGAREWIAPDFILRNRLSSCGTPWSRLRGFRVWTGLERQIGAFAAGRGRGLAYAYWPRYDSLCHEFGCSHPRVTRHFRGLDAGLERLARRLRRSGAGLAVTADHGLVDAGEGCCADLASVEGLYDCLATLPCGDARLMHCFVRPSRTGAFRALVRERLHSFCACLPGQRALEEGWFGPGRPHRSLASRVGDYLLAARPGRALGASVPGIENTPLKAHHGGFSSRELFVPLYALVPPGT